MNKMIKISESDLRKLLISSYTLIALESGGVDNWNWYSESIHDFLNEFRKEYGIGKDEEFYIEDMVDKDLEKIKKKGEF